MTIAEQLETLKGNIDEAYDSIEAKGGDIPSALTTMNLASAIDSIPQVDAYTKAETDTLLNNKADKSNTYTKTEVDTKLSAKANSADVYSKSNVDTALGKKANASDVTAIQNWDFRTFQGSAIKGATGDIPGCRIVGNAGTPKSGFSISNVADNFFIIFARQGNVWLSYKGLWDLVTVRVAGSGSMPNPTYDSTNKKVTYAAGDSYYNLAVSAWIVRG